MTERREKGRPLSCECGKLLAYERDGKIFVWCRGCRREVELRLRKAAWTGGGGDGPYRTGGCG